MNQSLQRVLTDFAQDDLPTPRLKALNRNGKQSNGWWIWTCEVTSTRSITTYSWASCKRKLEIHAFFASAKPCSTLATWRIGPTIPPTAVSTKAQLSHPYVPTSICTNWINS